jgi:hypothetical protein
VNNHLLPCPAKARMFPTLREINEGRGSKCRSNTSRQPWEWLRRANLVADYASGTSSESTRSRFDAFGAVSHRVPFALTSMAVEG